jgi:hypothetical protein
MEKFNINDPNANPQHSFNRTVLLVQPKRLAQNLTSNYWDYLNWAYSLTKFTWLIYYKIGHQEKKKHTNDCATDCSKESTNQIKAFI